MEEDPHPRSKPPPKPKTYLAKMYQPRTDQSTSKDEAILQKLAATTTQLPSASSTTLNLATLGSTRHLARKYDQINHQKPDPDVIDAEFEKKKTNFSKILEPTSLVYENLPTLQDLQPPSYKTHLVTASRPKAGKRPKPMDLFDNKTQNPELLDMDSLTSYQEEAPGSSPPLSPETDLTLARIIYSHSNPITIADLKEREKEIS